MYGPRIGRRTRGMGPNAGHNGQGIALMLMLVRQIQQMERKPPVTLGLMALMYGLHFQREQTPELFASYSLCPDKVLAHWDFKRIVAAGLIHVDDWHLYHNMASFLWKGYHLEYNLGSMRFLFAIIYLLVLCHALVIVAALALAKGLQMQGPLHQCSVGFSGVIFALKVLLNYNSPAFSSVYGFQVPTKYAAWLELVLIHFMVPRSSFLGHMCGILAGYLFVVSPAILSTITFKAISFRQWIKAVTGSVISRYYTETNAHFPSSSNRPPSFFETDEELALRLQEEEYRSLHTRQVHQEDPRHEFISPSEIRRRRLARFGNT